jgi:large subunit ribosomal protein L24
MARRKAAQGSKPSMKIKKGDHVMVTSGADRGLEGVVIMAYPDRDKVLVQGVNMIKKNTKVTHQGIRGAKEGGIVHQEAPVHVSNVQLIDPETKKPARVGYRFDDDGNKIRTLRPGGKDI